MGGGGAQQEELSRRRLVASVTVTLDREMEQSGLQRVFISVRLELIRGALVDFSLASGEGGVLMSRVAGTSG